MIANLIFFDSVLPMFQLVHGNIYPFLVYTVYVRYGVVIAVLIVYRSPYYRGGSYNREV